MKRVRYSYATILYIEDGFSIYIRKIGETIFLANTGTGWTISHGSIEKVFNGIRGFLMSEQTVKSMGWHREKPRATRSQRMSGLDMSTGKWLHVL